MMDEFTEIAKDHQPPKKGQQAKRSKTVAPASARSQVDQYLAPADVGAVLPSKGEPSLSDKYGVYAIAALAILLQLVIAWATSKSSQES